MFQMLLPLVPIFVEQIQTASIKPKSIGLLAGMYVIGLGVSATIPIVAALGMFSGLILAIALGVTDGQSGVSPYPALPWWVMAVMLLAFIVDRAYHHFWKGATFPPFEKG